MDRVQRDSADTDKLLSEPNVRINEAIEPSLLPRFLDDLRSVQQDQQPLRLELNTEGGDADIGRRIAGEIRLHFLRGNTGYVVGKTYVYSAGVTIFSAFPRHLRYLTADAVLLIHERHISKDLKLMGPIQACLQIVREELSLLETATDLETEGFQELVASSDLTVEQLLNCIRRNCYMRADQALKHGLIEDIIS